MIINKSLTTRAFLFGVVLNPNNRRMGMESPIIVALDGMSKENSLELF